MSDDVESLAVRTFTFPAMVSVHVTKTVKHGVVVYEVLDEDGAAIGEWEGKEPPTQDLVRWLLDSYRDIVTTGYAICSHD